MNAFALGALVAIAIGGYLTLRLFFVKREGAKEALNEVKIEAQKATIEALQERKEIDDAVQDDPDLVARARAAGVVRGSDPT
jgi:hypothetical protein